LEHQVSDRAAAGLMIPAERAAQGEEAWGAELWAALVGSIDLAVRSWCGIYEFSDDPDCVLRLGLKLAREPVTLTDGTAIEVGDMVGGLHFWNEHLPRFSQFGPELGWAAEMRKRLERSLAELAGHIEDNQELRSVAAFQAVAGFASRVGVLQLCRVGGRLGFEWVPGGISAMQSLVGSLAGYALTRVHNPVALGRQRFFRPMYEIWISRSALLELYGSRQSSGTLSGGSSLAPY
jgi:hypothetical protein